MYQLTDPFDMEGWRNIMSNKKFDFDKPLDKLIARAEARFGKVGFKPVTVGETTMQVLQVQDMPAYIERLVAKTPAGKNVELPLWAKIWPSSLLLCTMVRQLPVPEGASMLEVGGGVGVCGLFAAQRGLETLITDIEPDALLFSKINILKNGLEGKADVAPADFTSDSLGRTFDYVFGCEVVYEPEHYEPLAGFLLEHIADGPGREIVLAMQHRKTTDLFFEHIKDKVKIMRREFPLPPGEDGEERSSTIYRVVKG